MWYDKRSMKHTNGNYRYFSVILAVYVAALLISNIAATKLVALGPLILDGGAVLFPLVYIFDDVMTEVYGYRRARRAIWTAFGVMLLAIGCFTLVRYLPAAAEYHDQAAYEAVLGFFPQIVMASLLAFLTGSFLNSYIVAKLKVATKGRQLWLRLLGSTVVGSLFDTVIFCVVAFGGQLTGGALLNYIAVGLGFKLAVEVVCLPLTYRVIAVLKRRESVDTYDTTTNFTPFRLRV